MRKILKWILVILLLGGVASGSWFVYKWLTTPSKKQIEEHKNHLTADIQKLRTEVKNNQNILAKLQKGESTKKDVRILRSEMPPNLQWDWKIRNEEIEKLKKEKVLSWQEFERVDKQLTQWWKDYAAKNRSEEQMAAIQKNWLELVAGFEQDPEIHARFDKFIRTFYYRFTRKKGIANPAIKFLGFGQFDYKDQGGLTEMGDCTATQEVISKKVNSITININKLYLLNKLGHDKYFISYGDNKQEFISIKFSKMIGTIAHELAHASQYLKYSESGQAIKSQCESSGDGKRELIITKKGKKKNKLIRPKYPRLVEEHNQLTAEIKQMIINSPEYSKFAAWWANSKS